jgi:acyl-CoA reductase-like NAD-dependent aldehyde dehydrogenase
MTIKVINPYNQSIVAEVTEDDATSIETKLTNAQSAYQEWRALSLDERIQEVNKGLNYFRENADSIAEAVTLQMGKPINEAKGELSTLFERANYMVSIAKDALKPDILPDKPGFTRRIEHEPLGVILNLAAWNYPLIIPINVIIPALLAGNTVILKHSAKTPLCGQAIAKAFSGLSVEHLVQDLVVEHEALPAIIEDKRIQYVAFTGSVEGGHAVYASTAKTRFIDVGLELGGKDPAYVAEDADLEFAAENIVSGAFYNAGQSCCAVERVYVHEKVADAFLSKVKQAMKAYQTGDPLNETTTLGPLANKHALDFLEQQIDDAVKQGATLLAGGKRTENTTGNFFEPTLLMDVPNHTNLMQEESFAPIIPICRVKNDDEALTLMNDSTLGLTASVWTKDPAKAEHFAKALQTGTVFQNRCDCLDPALPWTGVKDSGKGASLSKYGFLYVTRRKSLHFRR